MATARKQPSGMWKVRVYHYQDENGKQHYKSFTGKTKKEAEKKALDFTATLASREDITFGEAVERYINSRSYTLSPTTIRSYRGILKNYLGPIKRVNLSKLTNEQLQKALDLVAADHAPKTVQNVQGLISSVLKMFPLSFQPRLKSPAKVKVEVLVPSDDDIKLMLEDAAGRSIELAIMLAAFGSLRRGEICGLLVDCVHEDYITIKRTMIKDENLNWIIKEKPKTYAGFRDVPLPLEVMTKLHAAAEGKRPHERVLDMCPQTIYTAFKRVITRTGLPNYKFHSLRHYFATFCHSLGIPDQYIAEIGGWDDTATLTKIYQHTMKKKKSSVVEMINSHYSSLQNS